MSALPKTYKAALVEGAGQPFVLRDVPLQEPGPGQVLVKVLACGVCFSDLAVSHGHFGPDIFPRSPGHEYVGDIVAVGAGVTRFKGGERVGGAWHGGHDGTCVRCQRGQLQLCSNRVINGVSHDGGFAEYTLLRAEAAVSVPRDMDPAEVAPMLCAGVTVFAGIRNMHIPHGALIAVQGLGGMGHLAVQFARRMGYEVAVLSTSPVDSDKAKLAKELGAHHFIDSKSTDTAVELMKLGGALLVIQTATNPSVVGPLIKGLAPEGKVLSLAPVGMVEVDSLEMVTRAAGIQGWYSGAALDVEETIKFAQLQGIKCMVEKYPMADVQKAVESLAAGKPRFRNVLVME